MTRTRGVALAVTAVAVVAAGPGSMAGTREPSRPAAPRQLAEALRSGTADAETITSIVRWVLEEEPEKVASGLASALESAVDEAAPRTPDPRWSAAARIAVDLFVGLLDDARTHRRRDAASLVRDLAPLAETAGPAVADALAEALRRPPPPPPR